MPEPSPPESVYLVRLSYEDLLTTIEGRAEGWRLAGAEVLTYDLFDPEMSARFDEYAEALLTLGDAVYGGPWTSARTLVEQAIKRFDGGNMARPSVARPCGQLEGAVIALKGSSEPVDESRLIELLGDVIGQLRVIQGLSKYPHEADGES